MRLELPRIVTKHKLLALPGVCSTHVLYTDTDILVPNPIEAGELLSRLPWRAALSYGGESLRGDRQFQAQNRSRRP